jgi:septation ring formation regulator EzrA
MTENVEDPINEANLVKDIIASYSLTPEDVPDEEIDPVVLVRPAQALAAIQTLREWELQQDDSFQEVVRQLRTLERRIKREQFTGLQQTTLISYFP